MNKIQVIVNKHNITIEQLPINEKEVNISTLEFTFDEEYEGLTKEAYFTQNGKTYKETIVNNECSIPYDVLNKGLVELGVVAYSLDGSEVIKRFNPTPTGFKVYQGSLKEKTKESEETPTADIEQRVENLEDEMETKQDTLTAGENITIENNVISATGGGGGTSLPTLNLQGTSEEKEAVAQQIYQNYIDGKDPNFYIMGMQGQQELGADKYNSSDIAVLREVLTPQQTDNGKYCIKFKAFDLTGSSSWDFGITWVPLKNMTIYIYYDSNGYSSWDMWYEDECYAPMSTGNILGMYNSNYYEPTDDYNPATKKYVDDGVKVVEITDSSERHDKTLEFANRYAKYGNCKLATLYQNVKQANDLIDVQLSNNYVRFILYYLPKRDINSASEYNSYYGLRYMPYVKQTKFEFYVLRSEFDNKDITEIYQDANFRYVSDGMAYSWYSSTFMTPYYSTSDLPLGVSNNSAYTPSGDYNPATKKYVDDFYKSISGYDASKTQVLKNINGTLTWVDE